MKLILTSFSILWPFSILWVLFTTPVNAAGNAILVQSTTSTKNSGFYDYILPKFQAETGITVNVVAPGFIETPMTEMLDEKQREKLLGQVPVGRLGTPDEVASAVIYLATSEASYLTGSTLHVNGGMAMI